MTAAGKRLDFTSTRDMKAIGQRPYSWQKRAYNFYDPMSDTAIGEVWFAGRYISESLSRVRLVPAIQLSPDADPIPLTERGLDGMDASVRPPDDEVALLQAAVGRLTNSHGGQSDIMRGASLNNFLAGESFLIGRTADDGEEEWDVHSIDAIEVVEPAQGDRPAVLGLKTYPDDQRDAWISLADATVIRMWRRHPRFPELPDASMGAALTYCEDLFALTRMIRAAAYSRMTSGILKYPSTIAPVDEDDDDPDNPGARDPFMDNLIKHFSTPIEEPNSAAALVPFLLRMDPEDLQHVDLLDFARDIDRLAVDLRRESREAFAATIDLPADVMTGKSGLNDWSAWNVDEETFRVHLAPPTELICDSLTSGYLWPTLVGIDGHRKYRMWYDAGNLITHPNRSEDAKAAHASFVISDATLRDATGFEESDAPDEEEIARRIAIAQAQSSGSAAPAIPAGGAENGPPAAAAPADAGGAAGGVQGSARRDVRDTLGYQLAQIERQLIDRLLTAADAELRRALTRSGSIIATAARKRSVGENVRQITRSHPREELAARLGQSLLASLSLTGDELLDGAFDSLRGRWDTWVGRAQDEALRLIQERGTLDDAMAERMRTRMAADRASGWEVLQAALVANATRVMFASEQPTALGERDPSLLIDPHTLRQALSIAGGWPVMGAGGILDALRTAQDTGNEVVVESAATEPPIRGLMSGDSVREALAEAGIATVGYVWVYGDPSSRSSPFGPHQDLDGVEFSDFTDDVLSNFDSFPETDFLYPDDHPGCQCTYALLDE